MEKFNISVSKNAFNDIDTIYTKSKSLNYANRIVNLIENNILSLDFMPYRGSIINYGKFANNGFKKLVVENFIIVYSIENNDVIIHTVIHSKLNK